MVINPKIDEVGNKEHLNFMRSGMPTPAGPRSTLCRWRLHHYLKQHFGICADGTRGLALNHSAISAHFLYS